MASLENTGHLNLQEEGFTFYLVWLFSARLVLWLLGARWSTTYIIT